MTARFQLVDAALRALLAIAKDHGNDGIMVYIRADGRIEFTGTNGVIVDWTVRGDLAEGSADPLPSEALGNIQRRVR